MSTDLEQHSQDVYLVAYTGTSKTLPVMRAPQARVIKKVTLMPLTAITGTTTNKSALTVYNGGPTGTGTTKIAEKDFVSGVNAAAGDDCDITLSTTLANTKLAAGDLVMVAWVEAGSGLDLPESHLQIDYCDGT